MSLQGFLDNDDGILNVRQSMIRAATTRWSHRHCSLKKTLLAHVNVTIFPEAEMNAKSVTFG